MSDGRAHFQDEMGRLEAQAMGALDMCAEALERTMEALDHRDVELAQYVVLDDDRIDGRYLEVHQGVLSLLALQAPVAGDLRVIAALLHIIRCAERMGDQCVNVCKLFPITGTEPPVHDGLLENVQRMGTLARSQILQARQCFERRDVALAEDLARQDDQIDLLNRECFQIALDIGDDRDAREWAMSMLLIARALERIGDNAVDIGEQTAFVVTGLFREFQDASHVTTA